MELCCTFTAQCCWVRRVKCCKNKSFPAIREGQSCISSVPVAFEQHLLPGIKESESSAPTIDASVTEEVPVYL